MSAARPPATAARTTDDFAREAIARRDGRPYLRYRQADGLGILVLDAELAPIYLGRHPSSGLHLADDPRVSGRHARLLFGAGAWSIEDAGSLNGTLLNGRPVIGEQRLDDSALIELGGTSISFHDPTDATIGGTLAAGSDLLRKALAPTATQRLVLIELARPWFEQTERLPVAPTNVEIAARLSYQPATVRDAISDLYRQAGLARGAVNQRDALIDLAIRTRLVSAADYT